MSNPNEPHNPGQPQQSGPNADPAQPSQPNQNSGPQQPGPQQWAPQYAHSGPNQGGANGAGSGYLNSGSFPQDGSAQGYPGTQPGYPGEHQRQQGYVNGPYGGPGGQKQPKAKKPLLKRWWFWIIAIIVVIAMFNACSGGGDASTDEAGASSQDEKASGADKKESGKDKKDEAKAEEAADKKASNGIGDVVTADGWEITVNKIDDGVAKVGNEYLGAEAQGQFVTVDMSVKNTTSDPDYFFEDNIKLGDDTGNTYSADSEAGIYVDENSILFLEEINPGNTAKGVLVFDVPKDVSPDRLTFEGGIFSDPVEISLK